MKNLRKILVSSIILIVIGIIGLAVTLPMTGWGAMQNNLGTGRGHMFRNLFGNQENVNLDFDEVENLTGKYLGENDNR